MITSFPPGILICIDARYDRPRAFLQEDALQLLVDRLAQQDPAAGWDSHDIAEDETVRAQLVGSSDGLIAEYQAVTRDGRRLLFTVGQFDRYGAAEISQMRQQA